MACPFINVFCNVERKQRACVRACVCDWRRVGREGIFAAPQSVRPLKYSLSLQLYSLCWSFTTDSPVVGVLFSPSSSLDVKKGTSPTRTPTGQTHNDYTETHTHVRFKHDVALFNWLLCLWARRCTGVCFYHSREM